MTLYNHLYPSQDRYKYPKAGEKNAVVSIHVYDVENKYNQVVDIGEEKNQYIPRIKWTQDPNTLCVLRMNRLQNHLEYLFVEAATGKSKVILDRHDKSYIDISDDLTFLKDGKRFVITGEED